MEEKDYIESLENLLIFMCQTYEETEKVLLKLAREENNNAFMSVPKIQGSTNTIGIKRLSDLSFKHPRYGFNEIEKEIKRRRSSEEEVGDPYEPTPPNEYGM